MSGQGGAARPAWLFVLPWSPAQVGGVNQVVLNLANELAQGAAPGGAYQPLVLVCDWDAPAPVWDTVQGVDCVRWRVPPLPEGASLPARILFGLRERRFRAAFARFCRSHRVAAVNVHYPGRTALTLARALAHAGPGAPPLLISFHGTDLNNIARMKEGGLAGWSALLDGAAATVVCSRDMAARVRALAPAAPLAVVPNGLDAEAFRAMAGAAGPAALGGTLLSVGRFSANKGQEVLVRAFADIAPAYPALELVLAGARDLALEPLQALARDLGIAQRVRFLCDVPHAEVAALYAQARLFAFPSREEAFGIALLEAGALGLPVVASRVGGIPDIIDDGVHGLLVAPGDSTALAAALRRLLDNEAQAAALGAALRARVGQQFSWAAAAADYRRLAAVPAR